MHKLYFLLFLLFLICGTINPQSNFSDNSDSLRVIKLNEIVVSANKNSTELNEVASSISVLTAKEIESRNKITIADLLRSVEGVDVIQSGGTGQLTSVYLRGGKSNHTLILVDGIEVNDPGSISGAFDWSSLQTGNIERIEVLRGPQSTLYGSDALAGVISIFTKKGAGSPKLFLNTEGGSFNTFRGSAGFSGSYYTGSNFLKSADYSIFISRYVTDGISAANSEYGNKEKDFYKNTSLRSRLGFQLNKDLGFDFIYNLSKAKNGLDQNEKLGDDPNFISDMEESSFKASGTLSLFDKIWNQNLSVTYLHRYIHTYDGTDSLHPATSSYQYSNGDRLKFDWQNNFNISQNYIIVAGFETQKEQANSYYESQSAWGPYISEFPGKSATTNGIYLQNQVKLLNSFFASFGARYDHHDRFGEKLTYRIAPTLFLSETGTKLKATYGTAFKSPSVFYLYDPSFGNPNLKPEQSQGWDAGIEQYLWNERILLGVSYYKSDFKDMLGYGSDFKTINIDKAELKGWEVFFKTIPVYNFSLSANYTYTNSKDKGTGTDDSGKELIRKPKNKIGVNINYNNNLIDSDLEVINVGERVDKDFNAYPVARVTLKSYTLMNLSASVKLNKMFRVFGRLDNILNQKYEEVLYYGTAGINGSIGVRFNF